MIYLDNSSTTELSPGVKLRMNEVMDDIWANPSSIHAAGIKANDCVQLARRQILNSLGVKNIGITDLNRLVFTGSGTEANNLAIAGAAYTRRDARFRRRIIVTADQHPSVLEPINRLESEGCEVVRLSTAGGELNIDEIRKAVTSTSILISIMLVNNETGAVYDIKKAFAAAKAVNPNIICHCDAIQGFRKLKDFNPDSSGCDLTVLSAHKIHGPKGIGALYISKEAMKGRKLTPMMLGGGQENGMRSGTENVIGIAGFAEAASEPFDPDYLNELRKYLILNLPPQISYKRTNQPAPHIVNITLPGIKSETMLHYLSAKDIYVSAGSACTARAKRISNALICWGASEREADCSLRISIGKNNTKDEIDTLTAALNSGLKELVRA
ncbi:MAG: cysteine desulfurase [Clostridiales bacterium]|nr:cysteine desulfurase [Clostridiales bacterium]